MCALLQWRHRSNTVPRLHRGKGQLKRKRILFSFASSILAGDGCVRQKVSHRVMAVSRKEGIQHEIELSAAWGPTVVSATGLPTSLSAHQMPTDLSAFHGLTGPVGPPVADRIPNGDLSAIERPTGCYMSQVKWRKLPER